MGIERQPWTTQNTVRALGTGVHPLCFSKLPPQAVFQNSSVVLLVEPGWRNPGVQFQVCIRRLMRGPNLAGASTTGRADFREGHHALCCQHGGDIMRRHSAVWNALAK